jgi:hypothetical protein
LDNRFLYYIRSRFARFRRMPCRFARLADVAGIVYGASRRWFGLANALQSGNPSLEIWSSGGCRFETLGAFTVIATALLNPFQAAIGVGRHVGFVLIATSFEARLVGVLNGVGR